MGESVTWRATTRQKAFLYCEADDVLYGGAAGGGKTDALIIYFILRRTKHAGSRGLLLRRTFPELERNIILRSQELLAGTGAVYQSQHRRWRFPNGSIQEFGYLDRDSDVHQYQGAEYDDIAFDELTHFTEYQAKYLRSRLRTTDPSVTPQLRGTTNPGGEGHGWVKATYIEPAPPETVWSGDDGMTRCFIPARVYDNPHLLGADPQYVQRLQSLGEAERRALLDGDWDVFAGQYYPEWRRDIHVIEPFAIPDEWQRFRSLDYGLDCTACYWWAVAPDQTEYVYRELYEPNLSLSDAAKKIVGLTPNAERIKYTVASPDLWNRRQDSGVAGVETMTAAGLLGLIKADNRRVPGWRELREHLKPYDDPNEGRTRAKLQVFSTCRGLITELPALVHDDKDPEDVSDKVVDHAAESVRYGVQSRPRAAVHKPIEDTSPEARAKRDIERTIRARRSPVVRWD